MADQEPASGANGSGEDSSEPQVSILAQYIKDLSVENPSAPQVYSVAGAAEPRRPVQHCHQSRRRRRP